MERRTCLYLILFILLLSLSGCFGFGSEATPTVAATNTATAAPIAADPIPISLAELAANPEIYQNQPLRLTGRYTPRPRLVCEGQTHRSPATWGLAGGEVLAYAGGLDQLRQLLPQDLEMTVQGTWRQWKGLVGCGKQATQQEIWYLAVNEIISPSPISRLTLTPTALSADLIARTTPGSSPSAATPTLLPETTISPSPLPTIAATPTLLSTATPTLLSTATPTSSALTPTATVALSPTATISNGVTLTPTASPTGGPSPTVDATQRGGTASPTPPNGDGDASTATPSATPAPNTTPTATGAPLPSATPDDATVVEMGLFEDEFLAVEGLGTGEVHNWILDVAANATLSVTVGAPTADIRLQLLDDSGAVLATQDDGGSGAMETLSYTVDAAAQYEFQVRTADDAAASYVMMLLYDSSYAFLLQDFLSYGDSESVPLAADSDHFWHFVGSSGDEISIFVVPSSNADVFLEPYGTEATTIGDFTDEGGAGEAESLESFTLPTDGIYSIRVGEFDYRSARYQISLVKNN